eukprot:485934_1
MSTKNTLKVAIFGAGRMGTFHAQNIDENIDCATIDTIVDINLNAAKKLSNLLKNSSNIKISSDYKSVLDKNNIDCCVIAITTTVSDRSKIAVYALNKRIPVFIEKPLASTLKQGINIHETVISTNTLFQIGFMRRFDTDLHKLSILSFDNKTIGQPYLIRVVSYDGIIQPTKYYKHSGGIFKDMMCHDLDSLYYILSSCYFNDKYKTDPTILNTNNNPNIGKIQYVSAHGDVNVDSGFKSFNDIDTAVVVVKFKNGCIGIVENCRYAIYGHDTRAEVLGCHGRIEIGPNYQNTVKIANENGYKTADKLKEHVERYKYTFNLEMKAFINDVMNKRNVVSTQAANIYDGLWNLLLIKACEVSKQFNGVRVDLPPTLQEAKNWTFKPYTISKL